MPSVRTQGWGGLGLRHTRSLTKKNQMKESLRNDLSGGRAGCEIDSISGVLDPVYARDVFICASTFIGVQVTMHVGVHVGEDDDVNVKDGVGDGANVILCMQEEVYVIVGATVHIAVGGGVVVGLDDSVSACGGCGNGWCCRNYEKQPKIAQDLLA